MSEPNSQPNQVYSKTETIKKLRQTIQQLEQVARTVQSQSDIPVAEIEALSAATQQLAASLPPAPPAKPRKRFRLVGIIFVTVIGAIAGVFIYFTLQPQPEPPSEVVADNPIEIEPEQIPEIIGTNDLEPETEIEAETKAEPDEPEFIETPDQLESPSTPEPVEVVTIPPPVIPTPEQSLIAAIQAQMQSLTEADSANIIQTIEPNFVQSRLTVTVTQDWQQLSDSRRLRLANDILYRSRRLDFSRVDIVDSQQKILARSPVIGEDMIIYDYSTNS